MKKVLLIALCCGLLYACKKQSNDKPDSAVDCSGPAKSFAADVNPIIQASCGSLSACHGTGSANGPGPLLNYTQVFNARSDIRSAVASGEMPLIGSLTASQKNAILCWIDNGALNN